MGAGTFRIDVLGLRFFVVGIKSAMRLTLGIARAKLSSACVPPAALTTAALAAPYINMATEALLNRGNWRGTNRKVAFAIYDDQFSLPRGLVTAKAAAIQGETSPLIHCSYPIRNEWYEFLPNGPGLIVDPPHDAGGFQDRGDGFVTFRDLPSAGVLKIYNSTAESTGSFHVRGLVSGQKLYTGSGAARIEGVNLAMPTTASTSTTGTDVFDAGDSLYSIVKPVTNGVTTLYHVADDLTETLIGRFEPGETLPSYRRYYVPCHGDDGQVVAMCKAQHYDVVSDNDEIFPGNINALEYALFALNYRRKDEMERSRDNFALALSELDAELEQFTPPQALGHVSIDPLCALSENLV